MVVRPLDLGGVRVQVLLERGEARFAEPERGVVAVCSELCAAGLLVVDQPVHDKSTGQMVVHVRPMALPPRIRALLLVAATRILFVWWVVRFLHARLTTPM